jgi:hypothetical protein
MYQPFGRIYIPNYTASRTERPLPNAHHRENIRPRPMNVQMTPSEDVCVQDLTEMNMKINLFEV